MMFRVMRAGDRSSAGATWGLSQGAFSTVFTTGAGSLSGTPGAVHMPVPSCRAVGVYHFLTWQT